MSDETKTPSESAELHFNLDTKTGTKALKEAILKFNLDEGGAYDSLLQAVHARDAFIFISQIDNELFRPARKHGYPDKPINDLLEKINNTMPEEEDGEGAGNKLIRLLTEKYFEMLRGSDIPESLL